MKNEIKDSQKDLLIEKMREHILKRKENCECISYLGDILLGDKCELCEEAEKLIYEE